MSKKANPKLVGGFVLGAVFLAVAGFFVLGGGMFREKIKCVAFFDGSVKGLSVGAPVAFRGVKVGTVTDIQLLIEGKDLYYRIPVFFDIEPARLKVADTRDKPMGLDVDRLIERGLRAQLTIQSFVTGLLMIELDFKPDTPVRLVRTIKDIPEIPTVPSDLEDFLRRFEKVPIEDLLNQVTEIVRTVREVVDSPEFTSALRNLANILQTTSSVVAKVDRHVDPLLNEGSLVLGELRKTLEEFNKRLASILANLDRSVGAARNLAVKLDNQFPSLIVELEKTLKIGQGVLHEARATVERVASSTHEDSPLMYNLQEVLSEVAAASRSIRVLSEFLQNQPESLLRGKRP